MVVCRPAYVKALAGMDHINAKRVSWIAAILLFNRVMGQVFQLDVTTRKMSDG